MAEYVIGSNFALKGPRFAANKSITNRKLLWHGTNVAVVAAILKTGLRIMPHSGGRVGRGIYFASENGKSSAYGTIIHLDLLFLHRYFHCMIGLWWLGALCGLSSRI